MKGQRIVRIPRSGEESSFILISVDQIGPSSLDLKLTGTEGLHPYVGLIRESQIDHLKAKNYGGTVDDWKDKVTEVLLLKSPDEIELQDGNSLQTIANVTSEQAITIVIKRDIAGITQRLGSIVLDHKPEEAIELFDWTLAAAQSELSCREQVSRVKAKSDAQEVALRKLRQQLYEFIEAKKNHESILISKFRELLNEKKLKIRDQQRLLVKADVEGYREEDLGLYEVHRVVPKNNEEGPLTRRSKRKAKIADPLPESDEEKEIKKEERSDDNPVSPHQPLTESDESEEEANAKKATNPETEMRRFTAISPFPSKEESQDGDVTESEEDEL